MRNHVQAALAIIIKKDTQLGPLTCGQCGGGPLVRIRGRYPGDGPRTVCPTCAVEHLEWQLDQLTSETQSEYEPEYGEGKPRTTGRLDF